MLSRLPDPPPDNPAAAVLFGWLSVVILTASWGVGPVASSGVVLMTALCIAYCIPRSVLALLYWQYRALRLLWRHAKPRPAPRLESARRVGDPRRRPPRPPADSHRRPRPDRILQTHTLDEL